MGFILTDICALGGVVLVVGFFISGFRLRRVVGPFFLRLCGVGFFSRASAGCFFRWHPRGGFAGRISFAGIRDAPSRGGSFSRASAMRLRGAGVAPVRGGTYFSLQRQRKVGKRKPLTPPAFDTYPRAPNVPTLHAAAPPQVSCQCAYQRLTRFTHPYSRRPRHTVWAALRQTLGRPSCRTGHHRCAGGFVRAPISTARQPTQSLPQWTTKLQTRLAAVRTGEGGAANEKTLATHLNENVSA